MIRPPPTSTLFPYTTLFRSADTQHLLALRDALEQRLEELGRLAWAQEEFKQLEALRRSEEHTSELQSRENLVCRLLLEKKKKINTTIMLWLKMVEDSLNVRR